MGRISRVRGYNFEQRVKRYLERKGWFVIRRGASKFPDLVCLRHREIAMGNEQPTLAMVVDVMFVECKMRGYLSAQEKESFAALKRKLAGAEFAVAARDIKSRGIVFNRV